LIRARRERREAAGGVSARPAVPLLEEDVNYWLRQFGGESALTAFLAAESGGQKWESTKTVKKEPDAEKKIPNDDKGDVLDNPFPPGYAEDLMEGFS
jgi:hypothetical protein